LLKGLGWAVGIVQADQIDFAAVDATFIVDHLEIGGFRFALNSVG
jgi:hypothetical protein